MRCREAIKHYDILAGQVKVRDGTILLSQGMEERSSVIRPV